MPRGRPSTTGTGHRGERVAVSPATARLLDAARQPGESRPQALARIVALHGHQREAIATALDGWADEAEDPWMSYCAGLVREGRYSLPTDSPPSSCRRCAHYRPPGRGEWGCPDDALVWSERWMMESTDTEPPPEAPPCPGRTLTAPEKS